jgi:acyl dehydratase
MGISLRHVLEQGPMLRTLGGAALTALRRTDSRAKPELPGPWISTEVTPPSPALVGAFVRNAGGDPSTYRGIIPPHLFPQWALPVVFKVLRGASYPLTRIVNAGCRFEVHAPLPAEEPLFVKARLESIDDDGERVLLTTRITTGTKSSPDALNAELRTFVPLAKRTDGKAKGREGRSPLLVPMDARELAYVRLGPRAGFDFAKLTGDFNPIHWVPAYARASGFRSAILHGFGTLSLAVEAIGRRLLSGDVRALRSVDVRFVKPLVLPARVGVYVTEPHGTTREVFVGSAPGSAAYLAGSFVTQGDRA